MPDSGRREKDKESKVANVQSGPVSQHSLPPKSNANHNNIHNTSGGDTKLILPSYPIIIYYVPSLQVTSYLRTKDLDKLFLWSFINII